MADVTDMIPVSTGWNLVSYAVDLSDRDIASVLATLGGAYDIVFGFDPSQGGVTSYFRDPNTSVLNNLATLERRQGYWLHITGTTGIDWPAR